MNEILSSGQKAAARRVRETEEHARRLVREHPVNVWRGVTFPLETVKEPQPPKLPDAPLPVLQKPAAPPIDREQALLLLLAALLLKNGAEAPLILALLYIAL